MRTPPQLPAISEGNVLALARKAKVLDDPFYKDLIYGACHSKNPALMKYLLKELENIILEETLKGHPFPYPTQESFDLLLRGPAITLGQVIRSRQSTIARYNLDWLAMPTLVVGQPMTGKTQFLLCTATQALFAGRNIAVFEVEKHDFSGLTKLVHDLKESGDPRFIHMPEVITLTRNNVLPLNPLEVQWPLTPDETLTLFVETFCREFGVLEAGEPILRRAVQSLYRKRGIYEGSDEFPTLEDLLHEIAALKEIFGNRITPGSRLGNARDSLLNKLDGLLSTNRRMFQWKRGYAVADLVRRSLVHEMHSMNDAAARFVAHILLGNIIRYCIATNRMDCGLQNLIIVDEAKWFAPPVPRDKRQHSNLARTLAVAREAGLGFLIADQTTDLDDAPLRYSALKICFRLGAGQDIVTMGESLGLNVEQARHIRKLGVGEAVMGMPQQEAVLIKTPDFDTLAATLVERAG